MEILVPAAFIFGFTQGFVVGPLTLFCIKEGLTQKHGFKLSMQVIFGGTLVEILYLMLATIGVTQFIDYGPVKTIMFIAAAYMLIHMAIATIRESKSRMNLRHIHSRHRHFYENDFCKAFLMSLVNPMLIVFCVMMVGSLYASYNTDVNPFIFALNINIGGFIASTIVAIFVSLIKRVFHPWMLKKFVMVGGMVLFAYGLSFAWKAIVGIGPLIHTMASSFVVFN
ncbi:MAG: LysE family transporter [Patescibacteria group bacterium]